MTGPDIQDARSGFVAILIAGAVVRFALWLWFAGTSPQIADELEYNDLATRLVETGAFCSEDGTLVSLRPPLYPAFLAGCYWLFGVGSFQAVRAAQAVLSLANVVVVHRIGSAMYTPRIGLWAAAFYCFYPSLLVFNNLLLTETLFTLLFCLTCLVAVRGFQGCTSARFVWAGLLIGLSALTRSVMSLFPPLLGLLVVSGWKAPLRRRLAAAITMIAAAAGVIAPWAIRNTAIHHTLVTVDVMGGRNMMMGNYQHTPMHRAWDAISVSGDMAWNRVLANEYGSTRGLTQGQIDKMAMRAGVDYVLANPLLTVKRDVFKFLNFWQLERELVAGISRGYFGQVPRWAFFLASAAIVGGYVLCLFSAVFGAILTPPPDWRMHALVLSHVLLVCGIHTIVFGHSRYHLPLIPLLTIYSAAAVTGWSIVWKHRRSLAFAAATMVCAALTASWVYEATFVDWQRVQDAIKAFS